MTSLKTKPKKQTTNAGKNVENYNPCILSTKMSMIQLLWKRVWRFIKIKNRTIRRYNNLIPGSIPKRIEIRVSRDICISMFIVALFTIPRYRSN
jgi:hypothetical protein